MVEAAVTDMAFKTEARFEGLDYHALNAMLNLYGPDGKIQFDADKRAAREYFLQHVNQNTVFFHNFEERMRFLIDNDYYEKELVDQYSIEFIERLLERFGEWLKRKAKSENDAGFVNGFITTSLVICVGAMAVVGSIEDGLSGNASMLYAKAVLDGVIVMIFASTYGKGAIFSAIPVCIFQGSITLLAGLIAPLLGETVIASLSFVGASLIFCVGINLIFGSKFKVANMLPSLLIAGVMAGFGG